MAITYFRRFISISLIYFAFAITWSLAPIALPVAVVVDLLRKSRFAFTRFVIGLLWVVSLEAFGILLSVVTLLPLLFFGQVDRRATYLRWNQLLVIYWGRAVFAGVVGIYSLRVQVTGEDAVQKGPMLLFLRHSSIADVFLGNELVAAPHGIFLRYAMKSQLHWEPCEDIVAPRVGCVFVERNAQNPAAEIDKVAKLARNLGPNEGVLIYPEGTRFTKAKKEKILGRLEEKGTPEEVSYARRLKNVLPPKIGGVLGLLQENDRKADVVFGAHVGFEEMTKIRHFWDGKIIGNTIKVHFWRIPFEAIPESNDGRREWLLSEWKRMDEHVNHLLR